MDRPFSTGSTATTAQWQQDFIRFAIDAGALTFGEFTLKSGRVSPYFFNAGQFQTGDALSRLGQVYARALVSSGLDFDLVFGPAYKGIPLATTTVVSLQRDHGRNVPYAFNRKEAKDHGEGGQIVGAPLEGRIVIVDDVITAGTAIREVQTLMQQFPNAKLAGAVVAMDRQEKAPGEERSAIQALEAEFGLPIVPVITFSQVIDYVATQPDFTRHLAAVEDYRARYGVI
ncbi:orotate phosphoribosyltransferase [Saccharospirillum impatiens]|uniref:orotate phosphoribosyltransferase n=1 Tax=Saccharospirillum impatiens TaxID=169438 RepID=UPI000422600F|nr:orotate phosphoribosyltransferase [Saccharospirillum impatiens]